MKCPRPAALVFSLLFVPGCSDSGRSCVTGTILLDGQPLASGSINFFPVEGTQGPNAGAVIENGKYRIEAAKGVAVGKNRVEIRGSRNTGKKVPNLMAPGTLVDEVVEAVPAEYNTQSTLVRTISPGHNTIDFDLSGARTAK